MRRTGKVGRIAALAAGLTALALWAGCGGGDETDPASQAGDEPRVRGVMETLREDPCSVQARVMLSQQLHKAGRYADQKKLLEGGVRGCPDELAFLNDYAYLLSTAPEAELRDGARALELSRQLIDRAGGRHPAYLDTLAAAYAETGDFESATRLADEALELLAAAGAPEDVVAVFREHREAFSAGEPIRE